MSGLQHKPTKVASQQIIAMQHFQPEHSNQRCQSIGWAKHSPEQALVWLLTDRSPQAPYALLCFAAGQVVVMKGFDELLSSNRGHQHHHLFTLYVPVQKYEWAHVSQEVGGVAW